MTVELRILCEGQTEQGFVTKVLAPHLRAFDVYPRPEPLVKSKFGSVSFDKLYEAIKKDVGRSGKHQYVTTMVDLYRLTHYPGVEKVPGETALERVARIERNMANRLQSDQFIPYVQLHEFEALVFVDLDALTAAFPDGEAVDAPARLRATVGAASPEEINDGPETAPSKRLIAEVSGYRYQKAIAGPQITERIGLARLRHACPHFGQWISKLETLTNE